MQQLVMSLPLANRLPRIFRLLIALLVGKIVLGIVLNYRNYLPPDFNADFLLGREAYFWKGYHWAFFPHIFSGPTSLILGTILISDQYRRRFPRGHKIAGRVQAACVIGLVAPSGAGMAWHAEYGPVAGTGFALLALLTASTMLLGWRAARQKRFAEHRMWMWRNYLLLFSTVLVRVNSGLGNVLGINGEWFYAHTAWTSWLVPLVILEVVRRSQRTQRQLTSTSSPPGPEPLWR